MGVRSKPTGLNAVSWYEEHIAKKKAMILKHGESFQEQNLFCPHCGEIQHDLWDRNIQVDGEGHETTCYGCEKSFFYKVDHVFSTEKPKTK